MTYLLKNKIKHFLGIFPGLTNLHLSKSVGMIPYYMQRHHRYVSQIITYKTTVNHFPLLDKELKGLNVASIGDHFYCVVKYLIKNAKNINTLFLYRFETRNLLYSLCYKLINFKGFVYLKLDQDMYDIIENPKLFSSKYSFGAKKYLYNLFEILFLKLVDLFSVETVKSVEVLKLQYPCLRKKLIYLPNCVNDEFINNNIRVLTYEEKEDIIITVGRIGSDQKNSKMLLDVLSELDIFRWKVYFIGPIEDHFQVVIKQFFIANPELKNKVVFTGQISDRYKLYSFYNRAKIYCHTAKWEGSPVVLPEAIYFGNYVVTTPVSGASDVLDKGRIGTILNSTNDKEELIITLETLINNDMFIKDKYELIRRYAKQNFVWKKMVQMLATEIEIRLK